MGHEMAGEVVDAGDSAFRAGEKVIIDPELYCGECFHCRIGQTHLCPKGSLLGRDANGGFAEYLSAAASQVFRLPESIDRRDGADDPGAHHLPARAAADRTSSPASTSWCSGSA